MRHKGSQSGAAPQDAGNHFRTVWFGVLILTKHWDDRNPSKSQDKHNTMAAGQSHLLSLKFHQTFGFPCRNIRFVESMSRSMVCIILVRLTVNYRFKLFIFLSTGVWTVWTLGFQQCMVWWDCHFWTDCKDKNMVLHDPRYCGFQDPVCGVWEIFCQKWYVIFIIMFSCCFFVFALKRMFYIYRGCWSSSMESAMLRQQHKTNKDSNAFLCVRQRVFNRSQSASVLLPQNLENTFQCKNSYPLGISDAEHCHLWKYQSIQLIKQCLKYFRYFGGYGWGIEGYVYFFRDNTGIDC